MGLFRFNERPRPNLVKENCEKICKECNGNSELDNDTCRCHIKTGKIIGLFLNIITYCVFLLLRSEGFVIYFYFFAYKFSLEQYSVLLIVVLNICCALTN